VITERADEPISNDENESQPHLTPEQRESRGSKFTWEPGDVVVLPDDSDDDDDCVELVEQSFSEDRWHGTADDIKVTSKPILNDKGPTT
jgi:hypothetical protein